MARYDVNKMVEKIIDKIQDGDDSDLVSEDNVIDALNQCNVDIATEIDVKELATVAQVTLTAGLNSVALPLDFLPKRDNLTHCYNHTTNNHVKVYASRRLLDRKIATMGQAGNIVAVASDFPNVYYQKSPSTNQTVDLYYHAIPDDLEAGGIFPSYIPSNYVYTLFLHYVCAQFYDFIEDGIEGEKVNTLYHSDMYDKTIKKFRAFIGPDPDEPFIPNHPNPNFDFENF